VARCAVTAALFKTVWMFSRDFRIRPSPVARKCNGYICDRENSTTTVFVFGQLYRQREISRVDIWTKMGAAWTSGTSQGEHFLECFLMS